MTIKSQSEISTILKKRVSVVQRNMTGPPVDDNHLLDAMQAGMSAPDHGSLKPYRYVLISGDDTPDFLEKFIAWQVSLGKDEGKIRDVFSTVPTFIFVFTEQQGDRIPMYEQEWTTAASVQNILNVLFDYGYACKWNSVYKEKMQSLNEYMNVPNSFSPMGYLMVGHAKEIECLDKKERPDVRDYTYRLGDNGLDGQYFK